MRADIIDRLTSVMKKASLDAIIVMSPENIAYVTGFVVPSQPLMRWRHAAVVLTADGKRAMLAVDMEETTVRSRLPGLDIRIWGEFTDQPMKELAALLADMGLAGAKMGTELDFLPAQDFAQLREALPNADFVGAQGLLARCRQIKSADEIRLMRDLSRISDRAINNALSQVTVGSSEMDIAGVLTRSVFELGANNFKLMIVATGERSVFPNVGPSSRKLVAGDICRVEIFAMKDGYHAGVCRTAYVRTKPDHAERIWRNLDECKHIILEMMKPGASSRAIYEAFITHLSRLGLPPIKFIGHGIGLHLHEDPYLGMYSDVPLEAGMVLGIEPLVYNTGYGFGMQNKDIVLVTESGSELLSDYTDTTNLFEVR
jgi:Xaa-Pro dipeptidase